MAEAPDKGGVSRRHFLKVAAGGIAGGALLTLGAGEVASLLTGSSTLPVLPVNLMRSSFAPHLAEDFKIHQGALQEVSVKLIEVSDIATTPAQTPEESFSVVFRGPHDRPLEQDTYRVEHRAMGAFPIFIVPIYPDGGGLNYEAVFNRLQV